MIASKKVIFKIKFIETLKVTYNKRNSKNLCFKILNNSTQKEEKNYAKNLYFTDNY